MTAPAAAPAGYAWEPTDEEIAARFGVPLGQILRFDLNTSPSPPPLATRILAAGDFGRPVSEYPPSDYRLLVEAAAHAYGVERDELLVGAGADELLDLLAKAYLPPGGSAVIPCPTYSMYRILSEQRPGRAIRVPRLGPDAGYALDPGATRAAARGADVVWLCSPNNPTGLPEPEGAIAALLAALLADALAEGRAAPVVVLDEAYVEFTGRSLVGLRDRYPRLVVVRTLSKAYALAGIRVGFAIAPSATIAAVEPYRLPGSVAVTSVAIATEALGDRRTMLANVSLLAAERERLAATLGAVGWAVGPSVTNFLLVDLGSTTRARAMADGLCRAGLVPRTFPAGHSLAGHLRLTVRAPAENDRLLAAVRSLAATEALP